MTREDINKIIEQKETELASLNIQISSTENDLEVMYADKSACQVFIDRLSGPRDEQKKTNNY